jgi:hypothetical protein
LKTKIVLIVLAALLITFSAIVRRPGGTDLLAPGGSPATVVLESDAQEPGVAPVSRGLLVAHWTDPYGFEDRWLSWRGADEDWTLWLARCAIELDERRHDPYGRVSPPLPELETSDPEVVLEWSSADDLELEVHVWKALVQPERAWAIELLQVRLAIEACFPVGPQGSLEAVRAR